MLPISIMITPTEGGKGLFVVQQGRVCKDGGFVSLDPAPADALFKLVSGEMLNSKPVPYGWFKPECFKLYNRFLPPATREILLDALKGIPAGCHPTLHIYSYPCFNNVPWELLHDGVDHLGLRFQIARMPIVPTPPSPISKLRSVESIYHVLGQGVVDIGDQASFKNWLETFGAVQTHSFPDSVNNPAWPTIDTILEAFDADVLYLTCHGQTAGSGWTLDKNGGDPSVISGTSVDGFTFKDGKPLVFANACRSAGGDSAQSGLATAFISKGTLNVVGTFAPVTRDLAIQFGRAFYNELFHPAKGRPLPIGEVLRSTKEQFHESERKKGNAYDPSYLFYCLYGPAKSRFTLAHPAQNGAKP
jgi:hypothetical protein